MNAIKIALAVFIGVNGFCWLLYNPNFNPHYPQGKYQPAWYFKINATIAAHIATVVWLIVS